MNCMFVLNFEAIGHMTLFVGPENYPESMAEKAVSFKSSLKTAKNILQCYLS